MVPVSALERKGATIERTYDQVRRDKSKRASAQAQGTNDQAR